MGSGNQGERRAIQPVRWRLAAFTLVIVLVGILASTGATGQGICGEEPTPPHCTSPSVEVPSPLVVSADADRIEAGEATEQVLEVDVTFESSAISSDDEVVVTVEPAPSSVIEADPEEATVSPGGMVTLEIDVRVSDQALAGASSFPVFVNTSATDVHEPTSQTVDTDLLVPWVLSDWLTRVPSSRGVDEGFEMTVSVSGMRVNGPVDFLVTSETHDVEPRVITASEAWEPGELLTVQGQVRLIGEDDASFAQVWPVVMGGDSTACLEQGSAELIPVEGQTPGARCVLIGNITISSGGGMGLVGLVVMGLILLGMIGAIALGVFTLRRGEATPPARALGAYLLLVGPAFGTLAAWELLGNFFGYEVAERLLPPLVSDYLTFVAFAFLPAAVLTFALSYPTIHPRLEGKRWWPAIPLVPSFVVATYLVTDMVIDPGPDTMTMNRSAALLGYMILVGFGALALFFHRRRNAATELERSRLLFMARWVATPFTLGAGLILVLLTLQFQGVGEWLTFSWLAVAMMIFALVPVGGMAWGLLKYRVVDLDRTLRFTVSRGFVGAVFIALFFAASEAAQTFFSEAVGPYVGILAAALLVLAISPLQRLGERVASGVVRSRPDEEAYRAFRKLEVYRATYEEATVDDAMTEKERKTLASLAESLGLSDEQVAFVEEEVQDERRAASGA